MRVSVTPEQIKSAFEAVKDDSSFDESRALWERGRPPVEMIQAMCLRPEILRGFGGFGQCVYPGGLLERRVKELVIITASQTNECQFCENSHCDLVHLTDIIIDPLAVVADPSGLVPRERLALLQLQRLRSTLRDGTTHVPWLRDRLQAAGLPAGDGEQAPSTTASEAARTRQRRINTDDPPGM